DLFVLGDIYERQDKNIQALEVYERVMLAEKEKLLSTAGLEGYDSLYQQLLNNGVEMGLYPEMALAAIYQQAEHLGGYIKAMRLYEKMGAWDEAENILQQQITITRYAGDERQRAIDEGRPGAYSGGSLINFNWLAVNKDVEAVAYDLYARMIKQFPRDPEWFKRAALFLHDRLDLAYRQMEPRMYAPFTASLLHYAYPWEEGEAPAEEKTIRFNLPGTGEEIRIWMPVYHPVKESFAWMQEYLRLSRRADPDETVVRAMAHLHSWMGNEEDAVKWYKKWIAKDPANTGVRYEAVGYMMGMNYLQDACSQLDTLYQRNQLDEYYFTTLSWYHALAGRYDRANEVIKHYRPYTKIDSADRMALKAKTGLLQGISDQAFQILSDSIPVFEMEFEKGKQMNNWRWYGLARLYALKHDADKAFENLKLAVDGGFNLLYVLDKDDAWKDMRENATWKSLREKVASEQIYSSEEEQIFVNPIGYHIPNFSNGYD
ncbi:MAG TPA: hypothetical protein VK907_01160, partial [Phnomibacter sp.]|nr:hypothetical protein [Phnomibacter sp.]